MYAVPLGHRRGHWIPLELEFFKQPCRCLGLQLQSSRRAASTSASASVSFKGFLLDSVAQAGLVYQLPIPAAALCAAVLVAMQRWLDYEVCGFLELFRPQEFLNLGRSWSDL